MRNKIVLVLLILLLVVSVSSCMVEKQRDKKSNGYSDIVVVETNGGAMTASYMKVYIVSNDKKIRRWHKPVFAARSCFGRAYWIDDDNEIKPDDIQTKTDI